VQADVTDADAVAAMRDTVHERFGSVDTLVNNAGINLDTRFAEMDADQWDRVIDVSLRGMFTCTRAFFGDLRDAGTGRLVNVSSIVGQQGNFGQANYATAKSGMFGFTRTLALELAPHGSTANCVAPGVTWTDMLEGVDEAVLDGLRDEIPLGRFAAVDEIAPVVRFLASEEASYITGEVVDVNGGANL
jgi:3-oxoacyl-[acyl-carrier protein] reductase